MLRELIEIVADTAHRLRLLLLTALFLIAACSMAALTTRYPSDGMRFAAALISLLFLAPLANEVYVRFGALWTAALGQGSLLLLIWLWGILR